MAGYQTLVEQDLKSKREIVFVDQLGRSARSLVQRSKQAGKLVIFRVAIHQVDRGAWFQSAVSQGCLRRFSHLAFNNFDDYWRADDVALDTVEKVYEVLKQRGCVPCGPLTKLYRDPEVELGFKKILADRLAEFY